MTSVIYRRWRSQSFAELVGQEHVSRTLLNALSSGRLAHAYLFCGPRGTGKTSTARILAKAINCLDNHGKGEPCNQCAMCQSITEGRCLDLIEIDAASNRRIEEIRDLREKVNFVPNEARYKVYIVDEVHMLTREAFNALLKTLEEPPRHTVFILATTEAHQVPVTIISRCQRFDFRRIPLAQMVERLALICREEGIGAQPQALELLAKKATGSLRDAENMLDQLVASHGAEIGSSQVQELLGLSSGQRVQEMARLVLKKDIPGGLANISAISEDGADVRQFSRQLVEHLRQLLLLKLGAPMLDLPPEAGVEMASQVQDIEAHELVAAIKLFAQADVRTEAPSTLPLELALVEFCLPTAQSPQETKHTPANVVQEVPETTHHAALPPRPAERTSPISAASSSDPMEQLSANWPRILAEVRQANKSIEALLRGSCKVLAVEDGSVTLGVFWDLHKSKLEDPKVRRIIDEIFSRVLGRSCQVKCILTPKESKPSAVPQPVSDAHGDPLVEMALKELGARVVSNNKEPSPPPDQV
ncbi:MAG: DNA polymerase III subunit gamma/tau [Dehalococcoidia bacterium]|nr:DNA polymerase III subunit gamma/tau [Dehalococcoidia bacterium]